MKKLFFVCAAIALPILMIGQSIVVPEYPGYIDTGNPSSDDEKHQMQKAEWINAYPDAYKKMGGQIEKSVVETTNEEAESEEPSINVSGNKWVATSWKLVDSFGTLNSEEYSSSQHTLEKEMELSAYLWYLNGDRELFIEIDDCLINHFYYSINDQKMSIFNQSDKRLENELLHFKVLEWNSQSINVVLPDDDFDSNLQYEITLQPVN